MFLFNQIKQRGTSYKKAVSTVTSQHDEDMSAPCGRILQPDRRDDAVRACVYLNTRTSHVGSFPSPLESFRDHTSTIPIPENFRWRCGERPKKHLSRRSQKLFVRVATFEQGGQGGKLGEIRDRGDRGKQGIYCSCRGLTEFWFWHQNQKNP